MQIRNDYHAHSRYSYCCDAKIDFKVYANKIDQNDFCTVAITDHSMAIYFPPQVAWDWKYMSDSSIFDQHLDAGNRKMKQYLDEIAVFSGFGLIPGIETEMMSDGRLTFDPAFRKRLKTIIGSVHFLPFDSSDRSEIMKHWKRHTLELIGKGIDILGHPFRWIANSSPVDVATINEIVGEAARAGVAIELNSHYLIGTDKPMLLAAIEKGAKISLGTDSHLFEELVNFSYHRRIFSEIEEEYGIKHSDFKFFKHDGRTHE